MNLWPFWWRFHFVNQSSHWHCKTIRERRWNTAPYNSVINSVYTVDELRIQTGSDMESVCCVDGVCDGVIQCCISLSFTYGFAVWFIIKLTPLLVEAGCRVLKLHGWSFLIAKQKYTWLKQKQHYMIFLHQKVHTCCNLTSVDSMTIESFTRNLCVGVQVFYNIARYYWQVLQKNLRRHLVHQIVVLLNNSQHC